MKKAMLLLLILGNLYASQENNIKKEKTIIKDTILKSKVLNSGIRTMPTSKIKLLKVISINSNPITKDKFVLGKKLYFDPRLSSSGLISCNTCHNIGLNGVDNLPTAIGDKWTKNPKHLNSPTVFNSVFFTKQFWDGRSPSLENQAIGPIQSEAEMNSSPEFVANFIKNTPEYLNLFRKIKKDKEYMPTIQDVGDVIAIFERTLVTPSKFDSYMEKNNSKNILNASEKRGLNSFIELGCASCHNGIALGGTMQPFPINGKYKYENIGKFKGDKNGMIKVPTLRNINRTSPYFHNGEVKTLKEAIDLMGKLQLGITIPENQNNDIENFLKSLEGFKIPVVYPLLPAKK